MRRCDKYRFPSEKLSEYDGAQKHINHFRRFIQFVRYTWLKNNSLLECIVAWTFRDLVFGMVTDNRKK